MAPRRGFRGLSPVRSRRVAKWGFGPDAQPLSLSSDADQLWTNAVVLVNETQLTIVRMRGHVTGFLLSATAAGDGFDGALGIALVSDEAFGQGAASVPNPVTEADWDGWIWHHFFQMHSPAATLAASAGDQVAAFQYEIDSKAMRKWSTGNTLVGVLGNVENGAATAEIWADVRILAKLS